MSTFTGRKGKMEFINEVEREAGHMRDKTLFQVIKEGTNTKLFSSSAEDNKEISSTTYCDAITRAIDMITVEPEAQILTSVGGKKPSKTYVIKCATQLGLRIFEGYPRVKTITDMCIAGSTNKSATLEDMEVYKGIRDTKYPVKDLVKPFASGRSSSRKIPVTEEVKNYVGDNCGIFKLSQSDLTMYFEALGLLALGEEDKLHLYYSEDIIDKLKLFKRLINERIYERLEEIEWHNLHKDKTVFDDCLEYDGGLRY